jgi:HEAT repeat protein
MSAEELFRRAVEQTTSDSIDDDAYWQAIDAVRKEDPAEVWRLVAPLAGHDDPRLRALVPDVLRYLGGSARPLLEQTVRLLKDTLAVEQEVSVIESIAVAFVDLSHPSAAECLLPLVNHPDPRVRCAVVGGLLPVAELAIPELITLSNDEADAVRDWATFGLGSQLGPGVDSPIVDTPEIREALARRLNDPHEETRAEATLGLALRKDERAIAVILRELGRDAGWPHYVYVEAAEALADPRLYDALVESARRGNYGKDLNAAIAACEPDRAGQRPAK